jgi:hypothetical protein
MRRRSWSAAQSELGEAFGEGLISRRHSPPAKPGSPWDTAQQLEDLEIEVQKHVLSTVFLIVVYPTGKTSKTPPIEDPSTSTTTGGGSCPSGGRHDLHRPGRSAIHSEAVTVRSCGA